MRTPLESIDASMSELFRMHDYRGMYEYYSKVIKPKLVLDEMSKQLNDSSVRRADLIDFRDKVISRYEDGKYFGDEWIDEYLKSINEDAESKPIEP
jgi:hypothetical protein